MSMVVLGCLGCGGTIVWAFAPSRTTMDPELLQTLGRIAAALERLAPPPPAKPDLEAADAFVWHPVEARLVPVREVSRVPIAMLKGIERQKRLVLDNTMRFTAGLPP